MSLWRWAMWYPSDSVGSEITKGKKFEFCSLLKRKDKSPDNTLGFQWSLFYVYVTQTVGLRKSESAGCNKVTVVAAPCCRNTSEPWHRREERPGARAAFSCVLHILCASFPPPSKWEMRLQKPFFCLPASIQIKWNVEITYVILYHRLCQYFGSIPISMRN